MTLRTSIFIVAMLALLVLQGCATPGGAPGPAAAAPAFDAGDRWVYRVQDGFRVKLRWEETHAVTAASPQGITVSVTARGDSIDDQRTELWSAPGVVVAGAVFDNETRRFLPPLLRYRFPLTPGDRWSQRLRDPDHDPIPYGLLARSVSVGGYERVTTPAGTFDAIKLNVFMRLDDETFWRWPTECTYRLWYAPELGVTVREEKFASYSEKGGSVDGASRIQSQRAQVELVSFSRGKR